VPEELWPRIKERLEGEAPYARQKTFFWERFFRRLLVPGLVPALTALTVLLLIGSAVFYNQLAKEQERSKYLSGILSAAPGFSLEAQEEGLGTRIEEYFL
jgi:hypothetical protein